MNRQVTVIFVFMNRALKLLSTSVASHSCTLRTVCIFFAFAFFSSVACAQDSVVVVLAELRGDDPPPPPPPPPPVPLSRQEISKRVKIIAGANILGYSASTIGIYHAWYKDYPQSRFHFFNDIGEWQQMDKIGHVYSAYAAGKAGMELWRWTGIDRKKRIWIGGTSALLYQTTIEVMDGFSTEWGWSWGDFAANITGSALLISQELAWDRQRIQMKWSFHRKKYKDPVLNDRSNELFGRSNPERFLKDYNGQTYWLSGTLKDFFPKSNLPAWLQVSVGTGAEGMFGGYDNIAYDDQGNITFDRRDIKRYRQWYLAPDIDLTRIKTNKKGVRMLLYMLNVFKFPAPSLELSRGRLSWNWIHF